MPKFSPVAGSLPGLSSYAGRYIVMAVAQLLALALLSTLDDNPQIPCDRESDFTAQRMFERGATCLEAAFLLPTSVEDCKSYTGNFAGNASGVSGLVSGFNYSKAEWLKILWSRCCNLGSKPNEICGFKLTNLTFPCDKKSDFEFASKQVRNLDLRFCQKSVLEFSTYLPSSPGECSGTHKGITRAT